MAGRPISYFLFLIEVWRRRFNARLAKRRVAKKRREAAWWSHSLDEPFTRGSQNSYLPLAWCVLQGEVGINELAAASGGDQHNHVQLLNLSRLWVETRLPTLTS